MAAKHLKTSGRKRAFKGVTEIKVEGITLKRSTVPLPTTVRLMEFFKSVPLYQDFYVSIFCQYVCCCLYNLWKPVVFYDVNLSFADEKTKASDIRNTSLPRPNLGVLSSISGGRGLLFPFILPKIVVFIYMKI